MESGQCFSDEKPVCLFHIPLVSGATSEGRGSTQTFLQDADVRIKSQTDSCTQQGEKDRGRKERERGSKGREGMHAARERGSHVFLNVLCVDAPKSHPWTKSQVFCRQRLQSTASCYTCKALCIYCSQGYCCYCYSLFSRCQADGKPCTMLPTSCALFQLLKGTGPDGV